MALKERVLNEHKEMPFFICKLEKAVLHTKDGRKTLEVWLERNNFVDTANLDERGLAKNPWLESLRTGKNPHAPFVKNQIEKIGIEKDIIIADRTHPIRWVGSGALLLLKDKKGTRFAILNKRHPLSSWPGYLDANGGFSSSIEDMLFPAKLGQKELKQEVIIKKNGKRIPIQAETVDVPETVTAVVHFKGQEFVTPNLILIVDPDTGVIDFRQIMEMEIDNIENFTFEDGETRYTGDNKEVSQGRQISVIKLKDLIMRYKYGEKFTPALNAMVEKL